MKSNADRTVDNDRGAVLVITAFIFIALVGVAALVVDIVIIHQARLRAQATADATVLAAALDIDDIDAATLVAKDYANRNYDVVDGDWASCADSDALAVATTVPCISIDDSDSPSLIRVRIPDRKVPSFFSSVLGHDGFTVSASAIAEVELLLVSPGTDGHGVDPNAPSVRDLWAGEWVTTATKDGSDCEVGVDPGCEGVSGYGEGCQDNFWEKGVPPDDGDDGKKKKGGDWREYIFVFEHTNGQVVVWCDTNKNGKFVGQTGIHGNTIDKCCKETLLPGGTGTTEPYGLALGHVSCSGNWASGWSTKDHPDAINDPEWRVIFYRLDKRFSEDETPSVDYLACESAFFGAVSAESPVYEPIIRLYG